MPRQPLTRFGARVRSALGADAAGLRQAFAALMVSSGGDLVAGLTLGSITHSFDRLPGLFILIPAAIGMRGNIFGALGSRLGTAIHTGEFRLSRRRDTLVGQNIYGAVALSLGVSVVLAVLAKVVASAFRGSESISIADFVVISVLGGALSSVAVLGLTLGVARLSERRGWDMDNVAAPVVTAAGDMVTLPSLFLASFLVDHDGVTPTLAGLCAAGGLAAVVAAWRARLPILRRIVRESVPVLVVAGLVDIIAGLTIDERLDQFVALPALLVLVPPFLEDTGALGSVLASRLATKLHLGIIDPRARPQRAARVDFAITLLLGLPVFSLVAISAEVVSLVFGLASPGALRMLAIALLGGVIASLVGVVVAYYGSVVTYRLGLDPDNHGVPLLTSSMDLVGAFALILAIVVVGVPG